MSISRYTYDLFRHGHTTLGPALLTSAHILIVHLGPALLPYPPGLLYVSEGVSVPDTILPITNLQRIIQICGRLDPDPGVVVASADTLLTGRLDLDPRAWIPGDIRVCWLGLHLLLKDC